MGNSTVNKTWKTINWKQAEEYVKRLQLRIVKATQQGKWRLVRRLQYLITHSFYAKALAVKKVISNKGKNTAGIDGIIWKTDYQKKQAIEQLNPNHYSPKAVRRIYIAKLGKHVLKFQKETKHTFHPTQKPVALLEYLVKTYTKPGEIVLDNCMGSGTTAIACLNADRKFIGFETNLDYYNQSLERIKENCTQVSLF